MSHLLLYAAREPAAPLATLEVAASRSTRRRGLLGRDGLPRVGDATDTLQLGPHHVHALRHRRRVSRPARTGGPSGQRRASVASRLGWLACKGHDRAAGGSAGASWNRRRRRTVAAHGAPRELTRLAPHVAPSAVLSARLHSPAPRASRWPMRAVVPFTASPRVATRRLGRPALRAPSRRAVGDTSLCSTAPRGLPVGHAHEPDQSCRSQPL